LEGYNKQHANKNWLEETCVERFENNDFQRQLILVNEMI